VASGRDQRGGKGRSRVRRDAKGPRQASERAKRDIRKLDREQGISAEMAAQLQAQWGNQAVAQLLNLSTGSELAATAAERRELGEEEEELLDSLGVDEDGPHLSADQAAGLAPGAMRGLPAASAGAGLTPDRQYGGDDDEDDEPFPLPSDPDGTPLGFDRSGKGNLARLQEHRSKGELPPHRLAAARSELERATQHLAARGLARPQPVGDALFLTPLEAWEDASLVAGRGCDIEQLQDLAGPYDALGRPMAVGAFAQQRATTPLGRSLARLCAAAPGTLMPAVGGLAGAAARVGSLAVLGLAAEGLHRATIRDRALRSALSQAALEIVLLAAGDVAESVPPAHTLYTRITGERARASARELEPGPVARHWVVPALRSVGQVVALPRVLRWSPPPPPLVLDPDDPVSVVDAALRGISLDSPQDRWVDAGPLLHSIDALLAAGGRAQVELATAALASRRPAFDDRIGASLWRAYKAFQAAARALLEARGVLAQADGQPLEPLEPHMLQANQELERLRQRMDRARERCLADLAAISELG
jgi:hypothetical protein